MKVEQLLKFSSVAVTEIVLRDENYTRVATVDYVNTPFSLHIDSDNKFYSTYIALPEYVKKLTVDFFLDSTVYNYHGMQCNGIRIYCKCPKKLK